MRFLRGLGLGIVMFGLWMVASIFGALSFIGEQGLDQDFDLGLVNPFWAFLMVVGFLGMIGGPLYYWVIEPIRMKGRPQQQYFAGPRPVPRVSNTQVANFCNECGAQNANKNKFCAECGANLLTSQV